MAPESSTERSRMTRERLIDCASRLIHERGIFAVTVGDVVSKSKVSRPTFYSHFGDMEGLLAELWLERGEIWLERLISADVEFDPLSTDSQGLVEVMLLAHRNSQIAEVVTSTVDRVVRQRLGDTRRLTVCLWRLANRIGILGTVRVWPLAVEALVLDDFIGSVDSTRIDTTISAIPDLPEIELDLEGTVERKLIDGVISIVSASGVSGLSILRLGRLLRVTSGYLQPRIDNMSELVGVAFSAAQRSAAAQNVALWSTLRLSPDGFARFIVGSVGDSRRAWRWFRAEVMLAAVQDPILARIVRTSMDELVSTLDRKTTSLGFVGKLSRQVATVVHTTLFGFTALAAVGVDVRSLAHEGIIRELLKEAIQRTLWRKS